MNDSDFTPLSLFGNETFLGQFDFNKSTEFNLDIYNQLITLSKKNGIKTMFMSESTFTHLYYIPEFRVFIEATDIKLPYNVLGHIETAYNKFPIVEFALQKGYFIAICRSKNTQNIPVNNISDSHSFSNSKKVSIATWTINTPIKMLQDKLAKMIENDELLKLPFPIEDTKLMGNYMGDRWFSFFKSNLESFCIESMFREENLEKIKNQLREFINKKQTIEVNVFS